MGQVHGQGKIENQIAKMQDEIRRLRSQKTGWETPVVLSWQLPGEFQSIYQDTLPDFGGHLLPYQMVSVNPLARLNPAFYAGGTVDPTAWASLTEPNLICVAGCAGYENGNSFEDTSGSITVNFISRRSGDFQETITGYPVQRGEFHQRKGWQLLFPSTAVLDGVMIQPQLQLDNLTGEGITMRNFFCQLVFFPEKLFDVMFLDEGVVYDEFGVDTTFFNLFAP